MATIAFASPKGGVGKSTAAILLGTEFAQAGVDVIFLDCDPNQTVTRWSKKAALPDGVTVLSNINNSNVVRTIKNYDGHGRALIVDLEGVASRLMSRTVSQADLVIIPTRPTTIDAEIALEVVALIADQEEALGRRISHSILLTMTRPVLTKLQRKVERNISKQGVKMIRPALMERVAFASLFDLGGDLYTMPEQGQMENARKNAQAYAKSVYKLLQGGEHESHRGDHNRSGRIPQREERELVAGY